MCAKERGIGHAGVAEHVGAGARGDEVSAAPTRDSHCARTVADRDGIVEGAEIDILDVGDGEAKDTAVQVQRVVAGPKVDRIAVEQAIRDRQRVVAGCPVDLLNVVDRIERVAAAEQVERVVAVAEIDEYP